MSKLSYYQRFRDFLRTKKHSQGLLWRVLSFVQKRKNILMREVLKKLDLLVYKCLYPLHLPLPLPLDLYRAQLYFSQNGEDGIIEEIFRRLEINKGCYVDFGAGDGFGASNTFGLFLKGWKGVLIEADSQLCKILKENFKERECFQGFRDGAGRNIDLRPREIQILKNETMNVECVEKFVSLEPGETLDEILSQTKISQEVDLVSIDIDGNDYWVWQSLMNYKVKVIIVEYNPTFHPHESKTVPYNPRHSREGTSYFGASARALYELGRKKNYTLVAHTWSNLFFIQNDYIEKFRPLSIGRVKKAGHSRPSSKTFLDVQ